LVFLLSWFDFLGELTTPERVADKALLSPNCNGIHSDRAESLTPAIGLLLTRVILQLDQAAGPADAK
jgi:hypothetical protein